MIKDKKSLLNIKEILGLGILCLLLMHVFTYYKITDAITKNELDSLSTTDVIGGVELPYISEIQACSDSECIDAILLHGGIYGASLEAFIGYMESTENAPHTICFNSTGGSILAAEVFAQHIRKYELNTCLASEYRVNTDVSITGPICKSACPFLFLAGKERLGLTRDEASDEPGFSVEIHAPGISRWHFNPFIPAFNYRYGYEIQTNPDKANSLYRIAHTTGDAAHIDFFHHAMRVANYDFDNLKSNFYRLTSEDLETYNLFTDIR